MLAALYVPCVLGASRATPLSHDELFTQYISGAGSLRELWADLRQFDLNPPLSYLLTRFTLPIDGDGALGLRLPEMAGFLVFLLTVFRFARVRMGALYGLLAGLLLMGSVLWELAFLARPYGLLLGFLGLALVGWQRAADRPAGSRRGGLALVATGCWGMLLSHVFGVVAIGTLLGAELWRMKLRRRPDRAVLLALGLPLLLVPAYLPLLRTHGGAIFPAAFQPDGTTVFEFYTGSVERELVALCLTALLVFLVLGPKSLQGGARVWGTGWFFTASEWCGLVVLIGAPLLLLGELTVTHGAFFARYGAQANVGFALLTTALLARWTSLNGKPDGRAALLGVAVVLGMSGLGPKWGEAFANGTLWPTRAHSEPGVLACQGCILTAMLDPALPLVDASGLTFVQMTHYGPETTTRRLFYLTDEQGSQEYAHANIFERMGEVVKHFHLRGQVEAYPLFLRKHPRFFVLGRYDYPEDWLLRKLVADGAEVRVLGRVRDSYRDTELYEVRVERR